MYLELRYDDINKEILAGTRSRFEEERADSNH